jgi:aspartate racemase
VTTQTNQESILGVLGGMGPLATAAFLEHVARETAASRDQDHVHVVVDSDPTIPDRTAFLLGQGPDPRPHLVRATMRLQHAGASIIAMPCNTASVFVHDIENATSASFVPWIGTVCEIAVSQHGSAVGILATTGTVRTRVYDEALRAMDARCIVPDDAGQRAVMEAIYGPAGVKSQSRATEEARGLLFTAASQLADAGAHSVILACTELPLLVDDWMNWPTPVLDPARYVARRSVQLVGGRVKGHR